MGRPERSLSDRTGPIAELAAALRCARRAAGSPSYRRMAQAAHYSAATLARAAAGYVLPSLEVTLAYATACGGERAEWADRWSRVRTALDRNVTAETITDREPGEPASRPRPAQLPAARPGFVGRLAELAWLDAAAVTGSEPGSPPLLVISGPAGVGKTTLALHWAHRAADHYRDGQLYADLRGFAAMPPLQAGDALAGFLRALGVPAAQVPADVAEAAAAYRSLLANARMLIVLDNAWDPEQVRPLLPGSAGCTVLVTSRDQLTALAVADGARPVALDLFSRAEARDLLARRLGPERVASESAATETLIGLCARLPLALSIAAARICVDSPASLSGVLRELREAPSPLDALETGDGTTDIRQVLSWSYQSLPPTAARMFRLLGLHPGPDLTLDAAASVAGVTLSAARPALRALTRRCLLTEHEPGRFACHDLLHVYAAEQAQAAESESACHLATLRLLDHYLHTAHAAEMLINPGRALITPDPPQAGVVLAQLPDQDTLAWFDAEHHNLLAAVDLAVTRGSDRHAWQLAWALATFFLRRGHIDDWVRTQRTALEATRRLGDAASEARIHLGLSRAYATSGCYDEASQHAELALAGYRGLGEQTLQGRARLSLNLIRSRQGRHDEALTHALRALQIFSAAGDRHGQAAAHNAVGWHHALRGDRDEAITHCTRAVQLFQDAGDKAGEAAGWDSLGHVHQRAGNYPSAVTCYQHAVDLRHDVGAHRSHADSLTHLGDAHHAFGQGQAARHAWQAALAILVGLGHPDARLVADNLRQLPGAGDGRSG